MVSTAGTSEAVRSCVIGRLPRGSSSHLSPTVPPLGKASPEPTQRIDRGPLGKACDGTFGNAIGEAATGQALELGWAVANWLQEHAETLGVDYLIWQGHIWSAGRAAEGWRDYDGGGMHDAESITGGHYDHVHRSAAEN